MYRRFRIGSDAVLSRYRPLAGLRRGRRLPQSCHRHLRQCLRRRTCTYLLHVTVFKHLEAISNSCGPCRKARVMARPKVSIIVRPKSRHGRLWFPTTIGPRRRGGICPFHRCGSCFRLSIGCHKPLAIGARFRDYHQLACSSLRSFGDVLRPRSSLRPGIATTMGRRRRGFIRQQVQRCRRSFSVGHELGSVARLHPRTLLQSSWNQHTLIAIHLRLDRGDSGRHRNARGVVRDRRSAALCNAR
ncbi:hypothetical protein Pan44_52730 [Caulifigura coniformis]|uniref:Uncharacterized protein n=1 Tax=Caulifigura coniformis TaxID=2527983 RepID=A0A517SM54_9PLAN|nr:hypothetical protein Pan44_52730 [Caulifigura coniformis]